MFKETNVICTSEIAWNRMCDASFRQVFNWVRGRINPFRARCKLVNALLSSDMYEAFLFVRQIPVDAGRQTSLAQGI
jgi:hypothetical protein